jgi:hypothetical protein
MTDPAGAMIEGLGIDPAQALLAGNRSGSGVSVHPERRSSWKLEESQYCI